MITSEPREQGFDDDPRPVQIGGRANDPAPNLLDDESSSTDLTVVDFGDDAGRGMEKPRLEEQLTPFLAVLQALSPQCQEISDKYLPDARPGMFLNSATLELNPGREGIEFVPVFRDYLYGEWTNRDQGGGFHGTKQPDDPIVRDLLKAQGRFRKLLMPDGHELVEQFNLYALVGRSPLVIDHAARVVMGFTSTKIGPYRQWFTRADAIQYRDRSGKLIKPPLWAHRWRLSTFPTSDKQGRPYYNVKLDLLNPGPPYASLLARTDPLYLAAREFYDQAAAGIVKVDYAEAATREPGDDDTPF